MLKKYIFLFALLSIKTASAEVLFAGGELEDFIRPATSYTTTNTINHDQSYSRVAFTSDHTGTHKTPHFKPSTDFWLTVYMRCEGTGSSSYDFLSFYDSDSVRRLIIDINSSGRFNLKTRNAAGTETTLTTQTEPKPFNSLRRYDIHINYAAAGVFSLYTDGVLVAEYTGDITTDGEATLSQIGFGYLHSHNNYETWYSQIIVADTDTRKMHLATIEPTANGDTMDWSGLVSDINEISISDSTVITSGVADELALFTIPALPAGDYTVQAVVQSVKIAKGATGPQNFEYAVRTGAANYTATGGTLDIGYGKFQKMWANNPATAASWTTTEIEDAGFNLGIKSKN
ncbi:MAG: hypothetical protein ACI9TY_000590 [Alphaproteobacteria bacterium]|jgi:hypothetical protein